MSVGLLDYGLKGNTPINIWMVKTEIFLFYSVRTKLIFYYVLLDELPFSSKQQNHNHQTNV